MEIPTKEMYSPIPVNIRYARKEDQQAINDIYNQSVAEKYCTGDLYPVSLSVRKEWFLQHPQNQYPVMVIEQKNTILGWASLSAYRNGRAAFAKATEISYYIDQAYRNRKLGSSLLEYALETAIALGYTTVFAIVLEPNKKSIALLQKFGFALWGCLPGVAIIDGKNIDHLYFGKKINQHLL